MRAHKQTTSFEPETDKGTSARPKIINTFVQTCYHHHHRRHVFCYVIENLFHETSQGFAKIENDQMRETGEADH